MNRNLKRIIPFVILLLINIVASAQGKENTDFMRSNGRIYVVIAVMLTILVGLILYLVRLERKVSKLEKQN